MRTSRGGVVVSVSHRSVVAHDCIGVPLHPRGRRRGPFCSSGAWFASYGPSTRLLRPYDASRPIRRDD